MTEEEWRASADPTELLEVLQLLGDGLGRTVVRSTEPFSFLELPQLCASLRKRRLFACEICRLPWDHYENESTRHLIAVSELYADGTTTLEALHTAYARATDEYIANQGDAGNQSADEVLLGLGEILDLGSILRWVLTYGGGRAETSCLLKDIFGNPFRPLRFDLEWRTTTVTSIAKAMYDSGDFSTMPVLADALQDAGCEHTDILDHCRSTSPHVRGCWVVDLVLGKE